MTVEILLATCEGERYVEELILSILNQTHQDILLHIRDDGSLDHTPQIIANLAVNNPEKIIVHPGEKKLGSSENFSYLLGKVKHNHIMFADQDDVWLPNKIELALAKMDELEKASGPDVPLLIHTNLYVVDKELNPISSSFWKYSHLIPSTASMFNRLIVQNVITGCAVMMNRKLVDLAYPIPSEALQHDWWVALVASAFGHIAYLNQATVLYRQHAGNFLGAKSFKSLSFLYAHFYAKREDCVKYKAKNLNQAHIFLERYREKLTEQQRSILSDYCQLLYAPVYKKIYLALKQGFYKNGFIRNLCSLIPRKYHFTDLGKEIKSRWHFLRQSL